MPLEDMLKVLEEEGKEEQDEVKSKAKAEADQILAEAKAEGERLKQGQLDQVAGPVAREKAKIITEARLEVKEKVAEVKSHLRKSVEERARERIEKTRGSGQWATALEALIEEAVTGIDGKAIVTVSSQDQAAAEKFLSKLGREFELKTDDGVVGAIASSEDGRMRFVNTVEARMARAGSHVGPMINEVLFEGGNGR